MNLFDFDSDFTLTHYLTLILTSHNTHKQHTYTKHTQHTHNTHTTHTHNTHTQSKQHTQHTSPNFFGINLLVRLNLGCRLKISCLGALKTLDFGGVVIIVIVVIQ